MYFSKDGKYLITRDPKFTVIWRIKDWKLIITIEDPFEVVISG